MSTPEIVINGTSGAYEQPQKFGWDTAGPYIVRTWKGTAAAMATQYNACLFSGAICELTNGYGTQTLTARYSIPANGATETPVDSWEFFASQVEKDVLETDNATIAALNDADLKQIKYLIANPPATPAEVPAWNTTQGADLYALMESGVRAIRVNAPILRHTQTVSDVWTVRAALTNVGMILSTATLTTFESIPSSVLFNLPTDVSTRTSPALSYGWMKLHPTIRTAARQKMQIELEYEYGLWAELLYGAPL